MGSLVLFSALLCCSVGPFVWQWLLVLHCVGWCDTGVVEVGLVVELAVVL